LEREAEVDQHRALLQHTFTGVSGERTRIVSEQREVTLLFADLRGFTKLANSLAPDVIHELLGQVMDCLTGAVMDHDGLVIDYFGDGLAAMWNAPADQAEHPELACRSAVRMQQALPDLAADWAELLPAAGSLRLGVGIHTGLVQVGNAGSRRRAKYGPRGGNVHLAARVDAATKCLHQTVLASEATAKFLSTRFTTARVCRAGLSGIASPVDLYALWPQDGIESEETLNRYARALASFESGDLDTAAGLLGQIDPTTTRLPAEFLANHVERLISAKDRRSGDRSPGPYRGVIALNGK
jgi:adenylate cyclase